MFPVRDDNPTRRAPVVNNALIVANIVVFIVQLALGERFVYDWSFVPRALTDLLSGDGGYGVVATMVSAMFLHGSVGHIVGNLLFLWIFGDNVEDNFGSGPYLLFYLLCGLAATLAQYLTDPLSAIPNLGASGAISGVLGAYIVLYPVAAVRLFVWPFSLFLGTFPLPAFLWIGIWFVMQLIPGVQSLGQLSEGGVAFWAHIGGFIAGLALIWIFRRRRPPPAQGYSAWR